MLPWKLLIWQMLQFMELFNCMKNGTRQHSPGSVSVLPRALSGGLPSAQLVFHPCRAAAARPREVLWVSGSLSLTQNFLYSLQTDFCHVSFLFFIFWVSLWDLGASWVALVVKKLPINNGNTRDMGLIPGWGRSPGGGHGNPLQYSCLENPMDRGAWRATVHRVTKSQTWLKWVSKHAHGISVPRTEIEPGVAVVKA